MTADENDKKPVAGIKRFEDGFVRNLSSQNKPSQVSSQRKPGSRIYTFQDNSIEEPLFLGSNASNDSYYMLPSSADAFQEKKTKIQSFLTTFETLPNEKQKELLSYMTKLHQQAFSRNGITSFQAERTNTLTNTNVAPVSTFKTKTENEGTNFKFNTASQTIQSSIKKRNTTSQFNKDSAYVI